MGDNAALLPVARCGWRLHVVSHMRGEDQKCATGGTACLKNVNPAEAVLSPLPVQQDTHLRTDMVSYLGVPMPIYLFRQPRRLSELELPFRILPLRSIDLSNVLEVPVD